MVRGRVGRWTFVLGVALVGACGDGGVVPSALLPSTSLTPTTAPSTTTIPSTSATTSSSSTARSTTTSPSSTTVPPTTSAAGPLAPVDTRNPVPVLPPGAVRAGEFLDAAVALPDGSFLVATGPDQFDLCSITILRVGADGSRTHFADGRAPQVAPNGRHVVYAARRAVPPDGCAAADPVIVDLRTGERHALDAGAVGDGEIAVDFIWSPDSARVSMMRGFYYSEFTTGAVVDVGARSLVRLQVVPALRAELEARLGIAPGFEWVVFPSRWLTDGSLAVETACCYGEHVDYRGVPQWWRLAPGGTQVRSFEQAITDDDLIARLSRGG